MNSVVSTLQTQAIDSSIPVVDLLRRALLVATKLNLTSFKEWLEDELEGYSKEKEIPKYRNVGGLVKYLHPSRGWLDAQFKNREMYHLLSTMPIRDGVPELEHMLYRDSKDEQVVLSMGPVPFTLDDGKGGSTSFQTALWVDDSYIKKIVDAVRTAIMKWAIQLEQDGILGDGVSFSLAEKQLHKQ